MHRNGWGKASPAAHKVEEEAATDDQGLGTLEGNPKAQPCVLGSPGTQEHLQESFRDTPPDRAILRGSRYHSLSAELTTSRIKPQPPRLMSNPGLARNTPRCSG